jgi:hypothetical protein
VGVSLPKSSLEATLDRAMRDARDPKKVASPLWMSRMQWLSEQIVGGDAKGKTYVAATGAALLAKATDDRVDTLSQNARGGPRGYSLRSVAEWMQRQLRGRVHLGTLSKWPMNNAPFLRGPARIERFVVAGYLRHLYDEYLDWMRELDGYTADQAYDALVAFLRTRVAAQASEDAAAAAGTRMTGARSTSDLLDVVQRWMSEDSEDGARGQAVVAAALDLAYGDVEVVPKHHPAPFDVKRSGSPPPLVCACKQEAIDEADVLDLARTAGAHDAGLALFAALAVDQAPLPSDRLRVDALVTHGTLLDVVHDVHELVSRVAVYTGVSASAVAAELPQHLADRCPGADVSAGGLRRLQSLLSGVQP